MPVRGRYCYSCLKYHVVKSLDHNVIAKYIYTCDESLRDRGGKWRKIEDEDAWCTNFMNSAHVYNPKDYKIDWREVEIGIKCGNVVGLNI